jgi:hypothetical protein
MTSIQQRRSLALLICGVGLVIASLYVSWSLLPGLSCLAWRLMAIHGTDST